MSITIISIAGNSNSANEMSFMISFEEDIVNLPTIVATENNKKTASPGSTAITDTGDLFVLGTDGVWRKW